MDHRQQPTTTKQFVSARSLLSDGNRMMHQRPHITAPRAHEILLQEDEDSPNSIYQRRKINASPELNRLLTCLEDAIRFTQKSAEKPPPTTTSTRRTLAFNHRDGIKTLQHEGPIFTNNEFTKVSRTNSSDTVSYSRSTSPRIQTPLLTTTRHPGSSTSRIEHDETLNNDEVQYSWSSVTGRERPDPPIESSPASFDDLRAHTPPTIRRAHLLTGTITLSGTPTTIAATSPNRVGSTTHRTMPTTATTETLLPQPSPPPPAAAPSQQHHQQFATQQISDDEASERLARELMQAEEREFLQRLHTIQQQTLRQWREQGNTSVGGTAIEQASVVAAVEELGVAEAAEEEEMGVATEDLSYDQLLELGARLGDVRRERWRERSQQIIDRLPIVKYRSTRTAAITTTSTSDATMCIICQFGFEEDEDIKLMPNCTHSYHVQCIDVWLQDNDVCPTCKVSILTQDATTVTIHSSNNNNMDQDDL